MMTTKKTGTGIPSTLAWVRASNLGAFVHELNTGYEITTEYNSISRKFEVVAKGEDENADSSYPTAWTVVKVQQDGVDDLHIKIDRLVDSYGDTLEFTYYTVNPTPVTKLVYQPA